MRIVKVRELRDEKEKRKERRIIQIYKTCKSFATIFKFWSQKVVQIEFKLCKAVESQP